METLTNQEFVYRQVPVDYDGTGTITSIKGNTIKFNQINQFNNTGFPRTLNGITCNYNGTNEYSVSGTSTALTQFVLSLSNFNLIANHKYYLKGSPKGGSYLTGHSMFISVAGSSGADIGDGVLYTSPSSASAYLVLMIRPNLTVNNLIFRPLLFDLTAIGIDNLTTPAQVEEWLSTHIGTLPYYDYTLGDLISFKGTGLKTVGFNQWDEEWEDGSITSSGVLQPVSTAIRSKNFCPCLPNTTYYLRVIEGTTGQAICWYDSAKNFIVRVTDQETRNAISPSNASYFKLSLYNYKIQDYVTYNNDVCLNISDISRNGQYEPYTETILSLPTLEHFPTGMKSAGTAYDVLNGKQAIQRMGMVDLGSLDWSAQGTAGVFYTNDLSSLIKVPSSLPNANVRCSNYVYQYDSYSNMSDKTYRLDGYNGIIAFKDSNFENKTATEVKNLMSGVYLIYELANPIITDITPPLDLTYPIENGGTEQLLPSALMNGQVDLGSLTWTYDATGTRFISNTISNAKPNSANDKIPNIESSIYTPATPANTYGGSMDMIISINTTSQILVKNLSYSSSDDFKQAMQGVILYYESTSSIPTTSNINCDIDYRGMIPVNATVDPTGSGTVEGTGDYRYHSTATLEAIPSDEIYRFLRWEDENGNTLSTNSIYQFEVGD